MNIRPSTSRACRRTVYLLLAILLCSAHTALVFANTEIVTDTNAETSTVAYIPSTANIANPERGFYHYIETRSSMPEPYNLATLRGYRTDEQITLLYCITYLDTFVGAPISNSFLNHIAANFATVRDAGLKCVVRFAYTDDDPTLRGEEPPFGDATKARILQHLDQLAPILRANQDIIAVMQAGFIGVWGEWYYTDHFVDDPTVPWVVSPARHADRLDVLQKILDILPQTRMAQVRYLHGKQAMFNTTTPLIPEAAYTGTPQARIGFHNDCFLASPTDFGTYREAQIAADKTYLAAETQFLPMGGESCNHNPPRSDCPTALNELDRFHWSYLNRDYNEDILNDWIDDGCFNAIARTLGYRLQLISGEFTNAVQPGNAFSAHLTLKNQGYAAPFNPRTVELVLRHVTAGSIYRVALPTDPRRWMPGVDTSFDVTVGIPETLPTGSYELLLHLPAPEANLRSRPEYAMQLANVGLWEADTGYHALDHILVVNTSASGSRYEGDRFFAATTAPVSPQVHVAQAGTTLLLSWPYEAANQSYVIHRSTQPFFSPTDHTRLALLPAGITTYSDRGAIGDPTVNYFYIVQAHNVQGAAAISSADSNQVGEIDYALSTPANTYSLLTLPFPSSTVTDAATLAAYIGNVTALLKWNPATQSFRFFTPPTSGDNFTLALGDVIFVRSDGSIPPTVSFVGDVTANQYLLQQDGFHFLMLPLQRTDLQSAAKIAMDLDAVQGLLQWNAVPQTFRFFSPPDSGDDFSMQVGLPFIVDTEHGGPTVWP